MKYRRIISAMIMCVILPSCHAHRYGCVRVELDHEMKGSHHPTRLVAVQYTYGGQWLTARNCAVSEFFELPLEIDSVFQTRFIFLDDTSTVFRSMALTYRLTGHIRIGRSIQGDLSIARESSVYQGLTDTCYYIVYNDKQVLLSCKSK